MGLQRRGRARRQDRDHLGQRRRRLVRRQRRHRQRDRSRGEAAAGNRPRGGGRRAGGPGGEPQGQRRGVGDPRRLQQQAGLVPSAQRLRHGAQNRRQEGDRRQKDRG